MHRPSGVAGAEAEGPLEGLVRAASLTWEQSALTVKMFGRMLVGDASLKNLSGPITCPDKGAAKAEDVAHALRAQASAISGTSRLALPVMAGWTGSVAASGGGGGGAPAQLPVQLSL